MGSQVCTDPEPEQQEVHCNRCSWIGLEEDLIPELGCPACLSNEWLEHKE